MRTHVFGLWCCCNVLGGCLPTGWTCEDTLTCPWMQGAAADAAAADANTDATDARIRETSIGDADADASIEQALDAGLQGDSDAMDAVPAVEADAGTDLDGAPQCDLSKTPSEAPCVIDERFGIFVAPTQNGSVADGSRAHPFTGFADAFQLATNSGRKRIYVCDGATGYTGPVTVGAALDGMQVFGGFECSTWTYEITRRAKLRSLNSPALTVTSLSAGIVFENFAIVAPDAASPGQSSVGVVVNESAGVVLRRIQVTAGKGKDATNGDHGGGTSNGAALTGAHGNDGAKACTSKPNFGGAPASSSCGGSETGTSGIGGTGGTGAGEGVAGGNGSPTSATTGKGGTGEPTDSSTWSCAIGNGLAGANGNNGTSGTHGTGLGTLSASGWTGLSGTDGTAGQPGQGGGGGGGAKAPMACTAVDGGALSPTGASGGSGGGGGCGGYAGKGGLAGGSSIALVSIGSEVTLESCEFVASDAGKGGNGGDGQRGGNGGSLGLGGDGVGTSQNACAGGSGGKGGNGGGGGGGMGGHSIGVAYRGKAPVGLDSTAVTIGAKGTGGQPGSGTTGKGDDGVAFRAQSFDLPDAGK